MSSTAVDSALLNYEWNNFLPLFLFARSATEPSLLTRTWRGPPLIDSPLTLRGDPTP
jgi:hypothetical protein